MITFCIIFPGWLGSNLPQYFPEESSGITTNLLLHFLVLDLLILTLSKPYDHPWFARCPQVRPMA